MKKDIKNRDYFIDLLKAFAIITIMLWHFKIIPTEYFIWAIPIFIFSTAALYEERWKEMKIKSVIKKIIWPSALIVLFTVILYFINFNNSSISLTDYFKNLVYYFFLRNPQLGNLWYFLLYFQIIILFLIMSFIFKNSKRIKLEKWYFGIISLVLSLAFSYFLLFSFGEGISFNVISWGFIIWLGLFNYSKIKKYLSEQNSLSLIVLFILPIILNLIGFYFLGNAFIEKYTHNFIFPTMFFQLLYFLSLFSLSTILIRVSTNKRKATLYLLTLIGQYSLYIYLFHYYLYNSIFNPIFGIFIGFVLTLISCLILGITLEKIRRIIKS